MPFYAANILQAILFASILLGLLFASLILQLLLYNVISDKIRDLYQSPSISTNEKVPRANISHFR